jgi:RNA polymerase sigma factor for flagellar operon FliA
VNNALVDSRTPFRNRRFERESACFRARVPRSPASFAPVPRRSSPVETLALVRRIRIREGERPQASDMERRRRKRSKPDQAARNGATPAAGAAQPAGAAAVGEPPLNGVYQELWTSYWAGPCDERRNDLVEAYQRLVEDVVRRFAARLPRSVDRGDLRTAANVGLMGAVGSYDPGRGVRFESYCEMRVRGALLDELRSQDWLPRPWRQRMELQKKTTERLRSELNRDPRDEEIARAMHLPIASYEFLFGTGMPGGPGAARALGDQDQDGAQGLEVVPDARSHDPGERLTRDELLGLVAQRLSEQEYRIVYLKYWEELPMREIGEVMGLSESRVCKIHARLIERLQDRFRVGSEAD